MLNETTIKIKKDKNMKWNVAIYTIFTIKL